MIKRLLKFFKKKSLEERILSNMDNVQKIIEWL